MKYTWWDIAKVSMLILLNRISNQVNINKNATTNAVYLTFYATIAMGKSGLL